MCQTSRRKKNVYRQKKKKNTHKTNADEKKKNICIKKTHANEKKKGIHTKETCNVYEKYTYRHTNTKTRVYETNLTPGRKKHTCIRNKIPHAYETTNTRTDKKKKTTCRRKGK